MTQANRFHTNKVRRAAVGLALLSAAGAAFPAGSKSDDDQLSAARTEVRELVQTQGLYYRERAQWALDQEILRGLIELKRREIEEVRERTADARSNVAKNDGDVEELRVENTKLRSVQRVMSETIVGLEERSRLLLRRLPEPVTAQVQALAQRIPASVDTETSAPLSERYQNVIGVFNAVNKFNRGVTLTSEVRELSSGASAEVAAIYLGIAQAYYVSADERAAGLGTAGPDGWVWRETNHAAANIALAIAIHNNEAPAAFVQLPHGEEDTEGDDR